MLDMDIVEKMEQRLLELGGKCLMVNGLVLEVYIKENNHLKIL